MAFRANANQAIGCTVWAIPEGYIPSLSMSDERAYVSHEAACILNPGDERAKIEITIYFEDRPPAGPYRTSVDAHRTRHLRFNDLTEPEPVPRDTPYSSIIRANVPVIVQFTRLDSRDPHIAILTTLAFPASPSLVMREAR